MLSPVSRSNTAAVQFLVPHCDHSIPHCCCLNYSSSKCCIIQASNMPQAAALRRRAESRGSAAVAKVLTVLLVVGWSIRVCITRTVEHISHHEQHVCTHNRAPGHYTNQGRTPRASHTYAEARGIHCDRMLFPEHMLLLAFEVSTPHQSQCNLPD